MEWEDILECPACRQALRGAERLDCRCGGYPVVEGIPVVAGWARGRSFAVEELLARHRAPATSLWEKVSRRLLPGTRALRRAIDDPEATFLALAAALGRKSDLDYFRYRFSDLSYAATCALLAAAPGGPLLDVGCGAGHVERALARRLPPRDIVGLDASFPLLYLARRFVAPECRYVCADGAGRLPFRDGAFRSLLCADTFNLFPAEARAGAVAEWMRVAQGPLFATNFWTRPREGFAPPMDAPSILELFRARAPRLHSTHRILEGCFRDGTLDLTDAPAADGLSLTCGVEPGRSAGADYFLDGRRRNPLYREAGGALRRGPLPESVEALAERLGVLPREARPDEPDLARRLVLLDLPERYC
jgi:SAM-dependent methyltransferase